MDSLGHFSAVAPIGPDQIQSSSMLEFLPIANVAERMSTQGFFLFVLCTRSLDAANGANVGWGWVSTSNWIAFHTITSPVLGTSFASPSFWSADVVDPSNEYFSVADGGKQFMCPNGFLVSRTDLLRTLVPALPPVVNPSAASSFRSQGYNTSRGVGVSAVGAPVIPYGAVPSHPSSTPKTCTVYSVTDRDSRVFPCGKKWSREKICGRWLTALNRTLSLRTPSEKIWSFRRTNTRRMSSANIKGLLRVL